MPRQKITLSLIENNECISSIRLQNAMPCRVRACARAGDGQTKYREMGAQSTSSR